MSQPRQRSSRSGAELAHVVETPVRSAETRVALGVARASVGLDVALLDASTRSEVPLGFAHGGSSKEKSVRAYYNYIFD